VKTLQTLQLSNSTTAGDKSYADDLNANRVAEQAE